MREVCSDTMTNNSQDTRWPALFEVALKRVTPKVQRSIFEERALPKLTFMQTSRSAAQKWGKVVAGTRALKMCDLVFGTIQIQDKMWVCGDTM